MIKKLLTMGFILVFLVSVVGVVFAMTKADIIDKKYKYCEDCQTENNCGKSLSWCAKMNKGGTKQSFIEQMQNSDVAIYTGHGRYGSGPDFDKKSLLPKFFWKGMKHQGCYKTSSESGECQKKFFNKYNKTKTCHGYKKDCDKKDCPFAKKYGDKKHTKKDWLKNWFSWKKV